MHIEWMKMMPYIWSDYYFLKGEAGTTITNKTS